MEFLVQAWTSNGHAFEVGRYADPVNARNAARGLFSGEPCLMERLPGTRAEAEELVFWPISAIARVSVTVVTK